MNQINKHFVKFLKDNHVLKQYVKNLKEYNARRFLTWEHYTNPLTIMERCLLYNLINDSFV